MEEQDLALYLLIDTSGSMGWRDGAKLRLAKQLAGSLAYLALVNTEQVSAAALGPGLTGYLPLQRGKAAVGRVWRFLEQLDGAGDTDLNASLRQAGRIIKRPGIAVLISDFLSPSGYHEGLKYLQHLGQQVDCENGEAREVSITPMLLQAYRDRFREFVNELRRFCLNREIAYHTIGAEENPEDIVLRSLRSIGVLG
jgi:uncharacterized protein (DUF58 family)